MLGSLPAALPRPRRASRAAATDPGPLGAGIAVLWLSVIVLIPLTAVAVRALDGGLGAAWDAVTEPAAVAALKLTVVISLIVTAINVVAGTLIAWVLVRDDFPGKRLVNALIDLPFALPTIVAGIVLLALYGLNSPVGVNVAFTRPGIAMALLFVTLPFVVRSVQPVLIELDTEMEEAAASLGAGSATIFARIILPNLLPAIVSGAALAFARAIGEFGSLVLISGNTPFQTEYASVYIAKQIETDQPQAAAAVSVVLLLIAIVVLLALRGFSRARTR